MPTISHRELRNNSGEILRRVAAGESFDITNHGKVVATIAPKPMSVLEQLRSAGQLHEASGSREGLREIHRVSSSWTTQEMINDLRGE